MKNAITQRLVKGIIRWLLLAAILSYIITGLGITESRAIEPLTLGWLSKSLAFKIHNNLSLLVSTIVLLFLHICFSLTAKLKKVD